MDISGGFSDGFSPQKARQLAYISARMAHEKSPQWRNLIDDAQTQVASKSEGREFIGK